MSWSDMLFNTHGRIRRRDFWIWMIGKTIVIPILFVIAFFAIAAMKLDHDTELLIGMAVYGAMIGTFIVTNIALIAKRWHDREKSGWMYLILFIPFIGWIWTLIECGFLDGTQGRNRYGRSPKGLGNERAAF
jgi:uncharacterized membrane protein YhaH (DUF805 family)